MSDNTIMQAQALADAYRLCLREGDQRFSSDRLESAMLQAIIASSAVDSARWIRTRLPAGDLVAQPVEALLPDLQKGNHLGQGLEAAKASLVRGAKSIALSLAIHGTLPVYVVAILALVMGAFGHAADAGASFGQALIPALVGGGAIIGLLVRTVQVAPAAVSAIGSAAGSLLNRASSLGFAAEQLFGQVVQPAVVALRGSAESTLQAPVVREARAVATTVVWIAYVFLGICSLYFVSGVLSAWEAYSSTASCIQLPTGGCAGQ